MCSSAVRLNIRSATQHPQCDSTPAVRLNTRSATHHLQKRVNTTPHHSRCAGWGGSANVRSPWRMPHHTALAAPLHPLKGGRARPCCFHDTTVASQALGSMFPRPAGLHDSILSPPPHPLLHLHAHDSHPGGCTELRSRLLLAHPGPRPRMWGEHRRRRRRCEHPAGHSPPLPHVHDSAASHHGFCSSDGSGGSGVGSGGGAGG